MLIPGLAGKNSFKKSLRGMKEKEWGRIIFVSSIAGYGAGVNGARKWNFSWLE